MYTVKIHDKQGVHTIADFADVANTMAATISEALAQVFAFIEAKKPRNVKIEIINGDTGVVVYSLATQ